MQLKNKLNLKRRGEALTVQPTFKFFMAHPGRPGKCDPGMESLFIDVEKRRNDNVKNILDQVGIDATDGDGRTALIQTAAFNNIELLKWLVKNGADINFQDRIGYTALHFAGQNKYVDIAAYLLESGADPNIRDIHGNTPLWTAIFNSRDEKRIVRLLLKHGANINLSNNYHKTPANLFESIYKIEITSADFIKE